MLRPPREHFFDYYDDATARQQRPKHGAGRDSTHRHDQSVGSVSSATAMVEAPLLGTTASPFTRTIAPLANQSAIVNLTVSGVTILPWTYDAAVAPPNITSVVNAGDFGKDIAPGGLISVFGTQLSPVNMAIVRNSAAHRARQ